MRTLDETEINIVSAGLLKDSQISFLVTMASQAASVFTAQGVIRAFHGTPTSFLIAYGFIPACQIIGNALGAVIYNSFVEPRLSRESK